MNGTQSDHDHDHDHDHDYDSMVIEWSEEDDAFVVAVPELPGCMPHGATYVDAVQQGEDAIATWLATARAWGDPIPSPRRFHDLLTRPTPQSLLGEQPAPGARRQTA